MTYGVWIGLTRYDANDAWKWMDNSPNNYINWGPGAPSPWDPVCCRQYVTSTVS